MKLDDAWTEGLTKRQQNLIIEYIENEARLYPGIAGFDKPQAANRFLNSVLGRRALIKYVEHKLGIHRDTVKLRLVKIALIRAGFDPAAIIDAQGKFVIEDMKDLRKLGDLSYAIDGIQSRIVAIHPRTGEPIRETKIELANREKSWDFLAKIFKLFDDEKLEDLTGEKSVYEMSDDERDTEIARLIKGLSEEDLKKLISENRKLLENKTDEEKTG